MLKLKDSSKRSHSRKPKTAIEVAKIISQFFVDQMKKTDQEEGQKLWDMLTALRGPDNEDVENKEAATVLIRRRFLGEKGATIIGTYYADTGITRSATKLLNIRTGMDDRHFKSHAQKAFQALGLKWDGLESGKYKELK